MRHTSLSLGTLILCGTLLAAPVALSQDGPRGIAFVQAPEQATGIAVGPTAQAAMDAAVAQCIDGGGYAEDCTVSALCMPAGWSIDLFVQHQEGVHWHEFQCGLPSLDIALSVGAALCDRDDRPYLIECALVQVFDPMGEPQL